MKHLSSSHLTTFVVLLLLFFSETNLLAQESKRGVASVPVKIKTTGKLLSTNKLVVVVDVEVPQGWKLKVVTGYESMWEKDRDTIDFSLQFLMNPNYQIVERLKAARKPLRPGYYNKDITFVQTLRINNKELPLLIDAELKLFFVSEDDRDAFKVSFPCLLRVCKERNERILRVGWGKRKRKSVYLEDVIN
jgi:hypothetical protein